MERSLSPTCAPTNDTTPATLLDLTYNYAWGAGDNGNGMGITNNRDSTRSTAYTYDALNRLAPLRAGFA